MKAFLWKDIKEVSDNYHTNGSVLIEAETLERAREIAIFNAATPMNPEFVKMKGVEKDPDLILTSESRLEKVWVFPNAGCC